MSWLPVTAIAPGSNDQVKCKDMVLDKGLVRCKIVFVWLKYCNVLLSSLNKLAGRLSLG